eukprot:scaffold8377_cov353-Pinguiococcus_pyrenoidosus.AAC.3
MGVQDRGSHSKAAAPHLERHPGVREVRFECGRPRATVAYHEDVRIGHQIERGKSKLLQQLDKRKQRETHLYAVPLAEDGIQQGHFVVPGRVAVRHEHSIEPKRPLRALLSSTFDDLQDRFNGEQRPGRPNVLRLSRGDEDMSAAPHPQCPIVHDKRDLFLSVLPVCRWAHTRAGTSGGRRPSHFHRVEVVREMRALHVDQLAHSITNLSLLDANLQRVAVGFGNHPNR